MKKINLPITGKDIKSLKIGDELLLSGIIYTARDMAHKALVCDIKNKKKPSIKLKDITIYYAGPTPAKPPKLVGSCGPTTSSRMDNFTPLMLKSGVKAMIGKGSRSEKVKEAIKRYKAVYFLAPAGCGALLASKIKKARIAAYKDFGPEAIYELYVKDFPVIVGIDAKGNDIY